MLGKPATAESIEDTARDQLPSEKLDTKKKKKMERANRSSETIRVNEELMKMNQLIMIKLQLLKLKQLNF